MVFYEHYLLLSHRMPKNQARVLLHDFSNIVTADNNGYVLRLKDLGWRRTAYRVHKTRVGYFHFGRWIYMSYGCSPETPVKLEQHVKSSPHVLRSTILKMKPKSMLPGSI